MINLTPIKEKAQSLFLALPPFVQKNLPSLLLILALGALFTLGIATRRQQFKPSYQATNVAKYIDNVLLIESVEFDRTGFSHLTVRFSQPVAHHDVEHHFTLSPNLSGDWKSLDETDQLFRFTLKKPFKGDYLNVHFAEGLKSTNNKTLRADYDKFITVRTSPTSNGRVRSYAVGNDIPFYEDPAEVGVYKSDVYALLSYLQYDHKGRTPRGSYYDGTFTESEVEQNESNKIASPQIDTDSSTLLLDPGIYYIDSLKTEDYFIVVSSFGALVRQDDQQVVLGAFDLKTGAKIPEGVTFGLYNLKQGVNLLQDFVYSEAKNTRPMPYEDRLDAIIAHYQGQVAFIPVELPSTNADIKVFSNLDKDYQYFLYTDRPIYKPGDTVFIRGVIRQDADSLYKLPKANTPVYIKVTDYNGHEVNQTVTLDEFGTFYSNAVLPKDFLAEYANVQASLQPFSDMSYGYGTARIEVINFTKPGFEIKTQVASSDYLASDKLKFTISANYFDGTPVTDKMINYSLYSENYYEVEKAVYNKNFNISSPGGMCGGGDDFGDYYGQEYKGGFVKLDDKGQAVVEASASDETVFGQKITLLAKVKDDSGNELVSAVNTIVHAGDYTVFFMPSAENYTPGQEVVVPFYAETLQGAKVTQNSFSYKLVDYNYDYYNQGAADQEQTSSIEGTVQTDDSGKGIITFTLPSDELPGQKQLIVSSADAKGNLVQNSKTITIMTSEELASMYANPWWSSRSAQTYLKIRANQSSFKVGDTVRLEITSPSEFDALLTFERGRVYHPQFIHITKGSNQLEFVVDERLSPSATVVLSYFVDGEYYTEGVSLNIPAMHKLLQIELTPDKLVYDPSETALLTVKTKNAQGAPVPAQLSLGVVDKAIYALRKSATPPMHSSFYYFRPRSTNASSSLTGIGYGDGGGGGGGGAGGGPGSVVDVLYWNPVLKTDGSGEVVVPVPLLGHETIWKIQVYGSTVTTEVGQADAEITVTAK